MSSPYSFSARRNPFEPEFGPYDYPAPQRQVVAPASYEGYGGDAPTADESAQLQDLMAALERQREEQERSTEEAMQRLRMKQAAEGYSSFGAPGADQTAMSPSSGGSFMRLGQGWG